MNYIFVNVSRNTHEKMAEKKMRKEKEKNIINKYYRQMFSER